MLVFLLSISFLAFLFRSQLEIYYRIWFLENRLKDVSLSTLQIGDKKYELKSGKPMSKLNSLDTLSVLNLAAYYQWNKEDPLFYSPDLDIDSLKTVINKINIDQDNLLTMMKENEHIYPTDFLRSFVEASNYMRSFLQNPSINTAKSLVEKQKQVAYFYKKESMRLSILIERNNPNDNLSVISLNLKKSKATIVSDLAKIINNSNVLLSEITQREKCLKGVGECKRPGMSFEEPKRKALIEYGQNEKLLDKKLIFDPLATTFDYSKVKGPYIAKTPCFGWGNDFTYQNNYFYLKEDAQTNIQLATDLFFRRLSSQAQIAEERHLVSEGTNYIYIVSSTPYACSYSEYLAEISEMNIFLKKNKPILSTVKFNNSSNRKMFEKALSIEEQFFQSKYPSYENAQILSQYYGYLYKLISSGKILMDTNPSLKDEILRRKLVLNLKLGNYDKILSYVEGVITYTGTLAKLEWTPDNTFVTKILYPYRNFYGVMYMPFSPAIFRQSEKLSYIDKVLVKNAMIIDGPAMSYTQAVKKYSQGVILRWFASQPEYYKEFKKIIPQN